MLSSSTRLGLLNKNIAILFGATSGLEMIHFTFKLVASLYFISDSQHGHKLVLNVCSLVVAGDMQETWVDDVLAYSTFSFGKGQL